MIRFYRQVYVDRLDPIIFLTVSVISSGQDYDEGSVGLILVKTSTMRVTIPIMICLHGLSYPYLVFFNSRRTPPLLNPSLVLFSQQSAWGTHICSDGKKGGNYLKWWSLSFSPSFLFSVKRVQDDGLTWNSHTRTEGTDPGTYILTCIVTWTGRPWDVQVVSEQLPRGIHSFCLLSPIVHGIRTKQRYTYSIFIRCH
jgi:hypothetical protein